MLKKRIEALKDFSYKSQLFAREFNKGDIAIVTFENEAVYKALLSFGNFKEVYNPVKVVRRSVSVSPDGRPIPIAVPVVGKPPTEVAEQVPPDGEPVKNICGYCSRSFATKRGLSMHIARTHKDEVEIPIAEQSTKLPPLEPGTKPEDYVEEKVEEKIEELCPNCQATMVVEGKESIPGEGMKVFWICPICGEKKEIFKRSK